MKKKYILIWSLLLLSPCFVLSQIVNEGIIDIKPSTEVYFANSYRNIGTHSNNGLLYLNNNFINDGITSAPVSGTTYFSSSDNPILNVMGATKSAHFYNLEVNVTGLNAKGVSVIDGFNLEVANAVNLLSGDLRLVGEAQLIQTHPGQNANSSTNGSLLRDQQGVSSTFGYNYWSSPVSNNAGSFSLQGGFFDGTDANINAFTPQQVSFNFGSPYNGIPSTLDGSNNVISPLTISDQWLYTYSHGTDGYPDWNKINKDSQILPGMGYTMKGSGTSDPNQNYVFKGLPNDGDYTFSINNGESILIGNPYPSALDAAKFINDNLAVIGQIELWVDGGSNSHYLSDYHGGYAIRNMTGGVAPSVTPSISGVGSASGTIPQQYIAVGQGFFVEATSNGTITFNNSQRTFQTEDGTNSFFYRTADPTTEENEPNRYIRIGYRDPEMFHRQLLLGFLPNSSADLVFNLGYDAIMLDPRDDEMFFIIENDLTKKYVIQGVGAYDAAYEFPIGLNISEEGEHVIMLDDAENFDDEIYIRDHVLNTSHNLTESNFTLNLPPGDYLDRFSVVFSESNPSLSNTEVFKDDTILAYYLDHTIVVSNKNKLELTHLSIFNAQGQQIKVISENDLKLQKIIIPFRYQQGMYFVKVEAGNHKKVFKIIN